MVVLTEASKEEKWPQPANPEVLSSTNRTTNIIIRLHIVSFAFVGGQRHKNTPINVYTLNDSYYYYC